jgi:hypothetical protein
MRKIACLTAALSALALVAAESPALAAMGQCFDASGRPVGAPHSTDNPPYGMICSVYRRGGTCSHVQPSWAASNCGIGPRYHQNYRDRSYYDYRDRSSYDYRVRPRRDHNYNPNYAPNPNYTPNPIYGPNKTPDGYLHGGR